MRTKTTKTKRKYTTITIPTFLFDKLDESINGTGFSSVSDYATYILRETLAEISLKERNPKESGSVVKKLKALGYIE